MSTNRAQHTQSSAQSKRRRSSDKEANPGVAVTAQSDAPKDDVIDSLIKRAGLRSTAPRRKILELFEAESSQQHDPTDEHHHGRHWSAEDIYRVLADEGDNASIATIYRVLAQFESAGLLVRHNVDGGHSLFELARLGAHHHLICTECGKMQCFTDEMIDMRQKEVAAAHGYTLKSYSIYAYVQCQDTTCATRS